MTAATAILSAGLFLTALWLFGVVRLGAGALVTARGGVSILGDRCLDDGARERRLREVSVRLFAALASIVTRGAAAVVLSFIPIWSADRVGLAATRDVLNFLSRWDVIAVVTLATIAGYFAWKRRWISR